MKSVTLVGRGPSWADCPFTDGDLWGTATCLLVDGMVEKNFTKVFAFDESNSELSKALDIALIRKIPIVGIHSYATEPFPSFDILMKLKSSYLMPTMSYMMAYALYLKYDRLNIYGIDQGPQWMYQFGKPHITHWWGIATGRGIDVRMGKGSLEWAYMAGLDKMPRAFLESEYEDTTEELNQLIGNYEK